MKQANTYIFIRADGFYPLELKDDAEAKSNAKCNPGTVRVETPDGRVVWQPGDENTPTTTPA